MKRQKTGRYEAEKQVNKKEYGRPMSWLVRRAGRLCITALLASHTGFFMLSAEAAPATLSSPDATVYEQTSEESNAIGNLVEGSSFEYIGDVTAEDGSVWHQITTSNGATGYIRGDREIATGEEAPAPEGEGGQDAPEGEPVPENAPQEGGEPAPAENGEEPAPEERNAEEGRTENRTDGEDGEAGREPDGDEDTENPEGEEGEGEPAEGDDADETMSGEISGVENRRTKSYSLDSSGRIKGREDIVPAMNMDTGSENRKTGSRIDRTVVISVAVIFGCAGIVYLCLKKLRRMQSGTEEKQFPAGSEDRLRKKIEKKKRKKKGRKK